MTAGFLRDDGGNGPKKPGIAHEGKDDKTAPPDRGSCFAQETRRSGPLFLARSGGIPAAVLL